MRLALDVPRVNGPFHEPRIRLELQGAHRPRLVADTSGHLWVMKSLPSRGLLAEAIGALLGRCLRVPVPKFAIFIDEEHGTGWLSSYVAVANHWQRKRLQDLANFGDLGKMLVLDALIYNEDRNPENILFEPREESESLWFWAIDMEASLVSRPRDFASKGAKSPDPFALPPDFETTALAEPIAAAVEEATALPDATLKALVGAAMEASGTLDESVLHEALRLRCRNAARIVKDYLRRLNERAA